MPKLQICLICAETKSLCQACQGKLDRGEITRAEVKLSEFIVENKARFALEDADAGRTLEFGRVIVIISESPGHLIGREGKVATALGKFFKKRIKVLKTGSDKSQLLADALAPVKVLGVNTTFKPRGGSALKIRIARSDLPKLAFNLEELDELLKALLRQEFLVAVE
jgi:transcription antitermination factor NusA-like protein